MCRPEPKRLRRRRYEVEGTLPAILAKRRLNRGIEFMAVSPDENFLYFIMQNPLANPDDDAYAAAGNTRLFKIERETVQGRGRVRVRDGADAAYFKREPSDRSRAPRGSAN